MSNYVKKTSGPKYTVEDVEKAVAAMKKGNKTYKQISEEYNIPITVIFNRLKGRQTAITCTKKGRLPALAMNVENDIEKCLIARAQMGQPCDKAELKELVREYVVINNISTPFTNNTPGDDWYYLFMKRHPSLSFKKPEQLQKLRKDARKPDIIYDFYDKLQQVYIDNNISDSAFVFNCDESGFQTDPSKLKAIGQKGIALSRISGGSGRESISVLACCAANGIYLPPFIIFKGKGVQARWTSDKSYPGTLYAVSNNGWMEETLFYNWLNTMFVDYINALRKERNMEQQKVVLLFDGHCSHSSLRIVQLAIQNNIIVVRFPSHLTDRLQPLDKCVFGPLKTAWNRLLIQFGKDMIGKGAGRLTKGLFSEMLGKLWNNAMNPSNIISGFSTTGLFPFDKYKFPVNEFDPVDLEEYLKCKANEESNDPSVSTIEQPDIIQHNSLDMHAYEVNNNQCFEQSLTPAVAEDQISLEPSTSSDNISVSSKDIISIFSNQLIQYKTNNTISVTKDRVPRLRAAKYGEVLTTEDVLKRLEEATSKKNLIKYPGKRGRPKKAIDDVENIVVEQLVDDIDDAVYHSSEDDCNDNSLDLSIEEVIYNTPIWSQIKPGVFLLVDFIGGNRKKQHFKYVCLVKRVDEDDGDILVQGLKKYNEIGTDFYIVENDLSDITVEMILAMLPTPTEHQKNRKTIYTFPR